MTELFREFNSLQNSDLNGAHPIIEDQTGLPTPPEWNRSEYATWGEFSKAVNFDSIMSPRTLLGLQERAPREIAKKWFQEQLESLSRKKSDQLLSNYVIRRKSK